MIYLVHEPWQVNNPARPHHKRVQVTGLQVCGIPPFLIPHPPFDQLEVNQA